MSLADGSLACVASVPVPRERNWGRAKEFFRIRAAQKMRREQKSGRRGVVLLSPPPPRSFHLFAVTPIFRAARMRKPLSLGPNFVRVVRERLLRRLTDRLNNYIFMAFMNYFFEKRNVFLLTLAVVIVINKVTSEVRVIKPLYRLIVVMRTSMEEILFRGFAFS